MTLSRPVRRRFAFYFYLKAVKAAQFFVHLQVRWNAATAVSNTLSSDIISPPHVDTLLLALSESLLSSDNYKVRIHATAALMMGKFLHDKVLGIVVERVERAQARLLESEGEGKVGAKEVDHFNMLKTKV